MGIPGTWIDAWANGTRSAGGACCIAPKIATAGAAEISLPRRRLRRNEGMRARPSIADGSRHLYLCGSERYRPPAQRSAMTLKQVRLDDKYDLAQARVFVTGYQALVRLCLMQKERDRRAGLNTAGYVTGYRGSPLGGLDQQFWRPPAQPPGSDLPFQGGLNDELAATALSG